jgi:diacylglycerol kinase family enzyme
VDRVLVLTHADAGGADRQTLAAVLARCADLGVDARLHRVGLTSDGADGPLEKALDERGDDRHLVVAGGDGTVHHVLAGLRTRGALDPADPIGIVPLGTGNDLARAQGLALDPITAVDAAVGGQPRSQDVLVSEVNGLVVNAVHCGIGALASRRAAPAKGMLGPLAYPVGAILAGVTAEGWRLSITVDGTPLAEGRDPLLMVGAAVGSTIGGGTPLAPDSRPGDGQVDVVIAAATGPIARVGFARALRLGEHGERDDVIVTRGRRVWLAGDEVPMNIDGEQVPSTRYDVWTVEPGAWTLRAPRAGVVTASS